MSSINEERSLSLARDDEIVVDQNTNRLEDISEWTPLKMSWEENEIGINERGSHTKSTREK